jgi:cytochrome P450
MSSLDAKSHAQRRRCVTQPYSKATLQNSKRLHEIMVAVLQDRLMPRLSSCPDHDGVVVNAASLCFATVMDIISGHAFGLQIAPNMTRDENKRLLYQRAFTEASAQKSMFWAQEAPMLSSLFPGTMRTRKAASFLESIVLSLCMQAEARCSDVGVENTKSTDFPGLYHSILRASLPHTLSVPSEKDRLNIASELLDHLKATSDVLSVTLTQALHELSKDQLARLELQSELRGLWDSRNRERRWLPSAKELDALPYLDAVVCETLRLRPTAPDGQPRISQSVDTDLLGVHIPADVRISTYPYILHHDEAVFEKPHTWNPQRWISPNRSQDMRLWAFGMGARACLGKDMTMLRRCMVHI